MARIKEKEEKQEVVLFTKEEFKKEAETLTREVHLNGIKNLWVKYLKSKGVISQIFEKQGVMYFRAITDARLFTKYDRIYSSWISKNKMLWKR